VVEGSIFKYISILRQRIRFEYFFYEATRLLDIHATIDYNSRMNIKRQGEFESMLPSELQYVMRLNGGVFRTSDANAIGISNERLRLLVKSGEIEKVAFGVYISPDEIPDKMYVTQLRKPKAIYSHETALYLHDLTDRDPVQYSVTVPRGYNVSRLREDGILCFMVKRELHEIGTIEMATVFGHTVVTYGLERTICDCIRSRNQMDVSVVTDAVKRYSTRRDKDLNVLMRMAEMFRVTKPLRSYLEVLL
jgi:predicted transcriptional regulator of viral defense system